MKTSVIEKKRNVGERRYMETGAVCELAIVALYIIADAKVKIQQKRKGEYGRMIFRL